MDLVDDLGIDDALAEPFDVNHFVGVLLPDDPAVVLDVGGEEIEAEHPLVDGVGHDRADERLTDLPELPDEVGIGIQVLGDPRPPPSPIESEPIDPPRDLHGFRVRFEHVVHVLHGLAVSTGDRLRPGREPIAAIGRAAGPSFHHHDVDLAAQHVVGLLGAALDARMDSMAP